MGRFIVTRTAMAVRFLLESASGMRLAVSRDYKNLDTCKKGIASLVAELPTAPLVDATAGERAPNPKIEMVGEGERYLLLVKARNGKTVLRTAAYATKKAARRAASMLRESVLDATVVLTRAAEQRPLKVKNTPYKGVIAEKEKQPSIAVARPDEVVLSDMPFEEVAAADEISAPDTPTVQPDEAFAAAPLDEPSAAPVATAENAPVAPSAAREPSSAPALTPSRLIRVGEARGSAAQAAPGATPKTASTAARGSAPSRPVLGRSVLLSRILKKK